MKTWKDVRKELDLSDDDEKIIAMEKALIDTMVTIREEQGLSQAALSAKCNIKQPAIARMEKNVHSPQLNSLLKVLAPLGYTLEIVPIDKLYIRDELSKQLEIARQHAAEGKVIDAYEASDNVRRKYKLK